VSHSTQHSDGLWDNIIFGFDMERRIFGKIFKNATAMHRHFCPKVIQMQKYIYTKEEENIGRYDKLWT
jgi:hypothetical protein